MFFVVVFVVDGFVVKAKETQVLFNVTAFLAEAFTASLAGVESVCFHATQKALRHLASLLGLLALLLFLLSHGGFTKYMSNKNTDKKSLCYVEKVKKKCNPD
ncbi:MAG: hypothetical protein JSV27_05840 [Candidatus Bathyarchaeota archaeon]|nr:MAG: hypothetical protein JSV27_05840 [Candidatus Bathyarchaeota archaeon]